MDLATCGIVFLLIPAGSCGDRAMWHLQMKWASAFDQSETKKRLFQFLCHCHCSILFHIVEFMHGSSCQPLPTLVFWLSFSLVKYGVIPADTFVGSRHVGNDQHRLLTVAFMSLSHSACRGARTTSVCFRYHVTVEVFCSPMNVSEIKIRSKTRTQKVFENYIDFLEMSLSVQLLSAMLIQKLRVR